MKRIALVMLVFLVVLGFVGVAFSKPVLPEANEVSIEKQANISMAEAKKIALKKVEGKITEEFELEDTKGKVTGYLFVIKAKDGKSMEVEIDAKTGEVLRVEEAVE